MKTKLQLQVLSLLLFMGLFSCTTEETPPQETPLAKTGTFSLNITLDNTNEVSFGRIANVTNTDHFLVKVFKNDSEIVTFDNYADMAQQEELEVGTYAILVTSGVEQPAAFDNPLYSATQEFTITNDNNTVIDITCALLNAKVNIVLSEAVKEKYPNVNVEVYNETSSLLYTENKEGYFAVINNEVLQLTAKVNYGTAEQVLVRTKSINDLNVNDEIDIAINYDPIQEQLFIGDIFEIDEKAILMEIYTTTEVNYENWGADLPLDQWDGVHVNDDGFVDSLDFELNNYDEVIKKLAYFDHLAKITLNASKGMTFPNEILTAKELTDVSLSNFNFDWNARLFNPEIKRIRIGYNYSKHGFRELSIINQDVQNLSKIEDIYLRVHERGNKTIFDNFGELVTLKKLIIIYGEKEVETTIPDNFKNLINLEELHMRRGKMTGTIPSFIFNNLNKLKNLTLGGGFTGQIPDAIYNATNLEHLSLPKNNFEGTIPEQISNLSKLKTLHLRESNLTGSIPTEISALQMLELLDLSENQLSGEIPKEIADLVNLTNLDLRKNQFEGTVPQEILDHPNYRTFKFWFDEVNMPN